MKDNVYKKLNIFVGNNQLKNLLEEYLNEFFVSGYFRNLLDKEYCTIMLVRMIKMFDSISSKELSWELLCKQLQGADESLKGQIIKFYQFIAEKGYVSGEYSDYLRNNLWIFDLSKRSRISKMFYEGANPLNILELPNNRYNKSRFNLNTDSPFIRNLLTKYLLTLDESETMLTRHKEFIFYFEESFGSKTKVPATIKEINYRTFVVQYRYYRKIKWESHCAVTLLVRFYSFLMDYIEQEEIDHKIFEIKDGIDKYFLLNKNFINLFDKGFRLIYYNRFESVPDSDRWLVAPNGEEDFTISKRSYHYLPIDFSVIHDSVLKTLLKKWFWETDGSFSTKGKDANTLINFVNYLEEVNIEENDDKIINLTKRKGFTNLRTKISFDEVIEYRLYITDRFDNAYTINAKLSSVKRFMRYIVDNSLLEIEPLVFEFLKIDKSQCEFGGHPILQEDLEVIVSTYKLRAAQGTLKNQLEWIIFNLCVTTNLRIGEVLNLKRECLQETMKKGQWALRYEPESDERPTLSMQRKGSKGTYKEENINAYTERMILDAKCMTEHLSAKADKEIKEYLFLNKSYLRKIRVVEQDSFYRRFKRMISEFPLKGGPYTVYNLRDTFMTNIFIQGKKDGKSIAEIHPATGHADMRTGIKHYRGRKIKSFLEAFHGVVIGNVSIKGIIANDLHDVVKELPENIDSITVKDKCGFCKQNGCPLTKEIDCLICTSFITTIDRIPFFKKKIALLDEKICGELIEHEKEHLKLIKRLCLGYLARLMELKVNISGSH